MLRPKHFRICRNLTYSNYLSSEYRQRHKNGSPLCTAVGLLMAAARNYSDGATHATFSDSALDRHFFIDASRYSTGA